MRLVLIIIALLSGALSGFASIDFKEISIEEALKIAQREGKYVFIDTYAEWCLPCKQMELVFVDEEVSTFFNTNFVNVRVDMDQPLGAEISKAYDVVWLPTLIILNEKGEMRSKIDKLVNEQELISAAIESMQSRTVFEDHTIDHSPFANDDEQKEEKKKEDDVQPEIITEDTAPVVYVHDERASSGRPHIMYHEAYLHLQLMDGKAYKVARKYLSTQEDWSTDKNMKFIFDFLNDVRSKEFDYFVRHRARFEELFGAQNVRMTIDILIRQHMEKAYPRPTYQEAIDLYTILDPTTAQTMADSYWAGRDGE